MNKPCDRRLTREEIEILNDARDAIQRAIRIRKPAARRALASRLYGALTEEIPVLARRASS
jgi:hypothetical protein